MSNKIEKSLLRYSILQKENREIGKVWDISMSTFVFSVSANPQSNSNWTNLL